MAESKLCTNCNQEKPLTEFYKRSGHPNLYNSWCKTCMKLISKPHRTRDNLHAGVQSEGDVIEALRKHGIVAYPGKSVSHARVDVVAWGCVGIEVKKGAFRDTQGYTWSFTPQQKQTLQADIIVLIAEDDFYVFPSNHAAFFKNGERKDMVTYLPQEMRKNYASTRISLTDEIMSQAKDAWHLIEVYRVAFAVQVRQGQAFPQWLRP